MKLTYRGVDYTQTPAANSGDRAAKLRWNQAQRAQNVNLRYRGATYELSPEAVSTAEPAPAANAVLTYRGVTYQVQSAKSTAPVAQPTPVSLDDLTRTLNIQHHRQIKQREQTMLSRLAAGTGIPMTRSGLFWNHIQGDAHPSFRTLYDRSHAAMS